MLMIFLQTVLLVPATLLPILNPFGNAPVFASMMGSKGHHAEARAARQVAINSWFLLMGAMLIGSHVLAFFGVSLPVVRVGGGLLVAAAGWRMLNDAGSESQRSVPAALSEEDLAIRSFYPISFPLTVGPGSIAAAITLGAGMPSGMLDRALSFGSSALGAALTGAVVYLCYRHANQIVDLLGRLGTTVVRRLSAFILLCVGIEIVWRGLTELLVQASELLR